jgi:hypothetical protein
MRLATGGDVVLAGFRLTREEWDDLDDVSRALLLDNEEDLGALEAKAVDEEFNEGPYLTLEILGLDADDEQPPR